MIAALLTGSAAMACLSHPALAHQGAPYQVLAKTAAGPYIASVWADPDVGAGTVYVMVQPSAADAAADSTEPAESALEVTVAARPADGHLPETIYPARLEPVGGAGAQRYVATVPFDAEGSWDLRIMLQGAAGAGELQTAVDVTPVDGPQLWEVGIYLLPFALLALVFVWARWRGRGELAERDAADGP